MQVAPTLHKQESSFRDRIQLANSCWDLWAFGITIVIGGQFFAWASGLVSGTAGFGIAVLLMGLAYVCLAFSMAEMSGMLPFAGGVYGLSRCTLGFYAGFMLGCFEILEYTLYIASVNVSLGKNICTRWSQVSSYQPLFWFISSAISFGILAIGGKIFWRYNLIMAIALILLVVIYVFGAAQYTDINQFSGGADNAFRGDFRLWASAFPTSMWFYAGIEALNTLCNEVDNPRRTIPYGQVASMVTLFATGLFVYIVAIALPPGIDHLAMESAIFNGGYAKIFQISTKDALILSLPASFASIPGFLLAAANIVTALADSKLIPTVLHRRHATFGMPVRAMGVILVIGFALCFCVMYQPNAEYIMYSMSMFFGSMTYISQCIGYLYLCKRYRTMERTFRSPFGATGACFAIAVFTLSAISIVFIQDEAHKYNIALLITIVSLSMYYKYYAKSRQTISEDERKLLFFAHIAIHNQAKRQQGRPKRGIKKLQGIIWTKRTSIVVAKTKSTNKRISVAPLQADIAATESIHDASLAST